MWLQLPPCPISSSHALLTFFLKHFQGLSSWCRTLPTMQSALRSVDSLLFWLLYIKLRGKVSWNVVKTFLGLIRSYSVLIKDCINVKWVGKDLESHWVRIVFYCPHLSFSCHTSGGISKLSLHPPTSIGHWVKTWPIHVC